MNENPTNTETSAGESTPRIVLASHNQGKLAELRELLRGKVEGLDVDTQVIDAGAAGAPDIVETGVTFEDNALLKARTVARETGLIAIADDSGLAVDVMGGSPGFLSARWAGVHGDDEANNRLLLAQMADITDPVQRHASFVCAAAVATPDGFEVVERGELEGTLLTEPQGDGGFGYDPIMQPLGSSKSLAEHTPEQKNSISHRKKAIEALLPSIIAACGNN
ncbi:RdgB/HAM1 family non-canonical purine NTP pyrophosphatase [Pseudoglutamicibacter cumminsii]|uniref:RdgB/HAM1 family non-canonical purine NTP pyrophosphatase n=1 Tax=Pseudoglutamicibacter cumminsii TaxID=156979 RepID=UPI0026EBF085|nr:RdgB/HAM1 family non-canonical purine NTP pyrophosphatase [Pseudoglutamicibacter cumminsii]